MYILATVRNTGSNWALGMLEKHLERFNGLYEDVGSNPHVFFTHTENDKMSRIRQLVDEGYQVIRTIRHPEIVAKSWQRRGWVLDHAFIAQWGNLFSLPGDIWLSVDSPYKQEMLWDASDKLGFELETDWRRVCSFQGDRYKGEGPNWDEIDDQITGYERFYPMGESSLGRGGKGPAAERRSSHAA